jgi:hypothetical protein
MLKIKNRICLAKTLLIFLIVIYSGCASIIKGGGAQAIQFKSSPTNSICEIRDFNTDNVLSRITTPSIVPLEKSRGYFKSAKYRVTCSLEGRNSQEAIIEGYANGWYIGGNIIFGGLLGYLVVDPATGAMWSLQPVLVSVDFDDPSKSILKRQVVSDNTSGS